MPSALRARCLDQKRVPHRRREVPHRLVRLEDGLRYELVDALPVPLGLGRRCLAPARVHLLSVPSGDWFVEEARVASRTSAQEREGLRSVTSSCDMFCIYM